jgi:hypothetical protein
MDISMPTLITGFLFSTIGFSVFLYGKKQGRAPQLIAGGLMMLLPMVLQNALWLSCAEMSSMAGLWAIVRAGN